MIIKILLSSLMLVSTLSINAQAQCEPKTPTSDYAPGGINGQYYLIASQKGFPYMAMEANCGSSYINDATPSNFPYDIMFKGDDGEQKITLSITQIQPPGVLNVNGDGGLDFRAEVIGEIPDKCHVFHACNPENNQPAVWVYNRERVQGLEGLDSDCLEMVKSSLSSNNIEMTNVEDTNNQNC